MKRERPIESLFGRTMDLNTRGLKCSYEIALLLAKTVKPHTEGEKLIKPCLEAFLRTVQQKLGSKATEEISALPISNDSVRRRIDEMSCNIENKLVKILQKTCFSLALDESTVRDSDAILMSYVRFVRESELCEEMLFCESLKTTTTAADIFSVLKTKLSSYNIPMENILSIAADGAPAMMGRKSGVLKLVKDEVLDLTTIHCVVHRENLVAQKLGEKLEHVLRSVIRVVNLMKSHPKMERMFRKFCEDLDEDHVRLILHTNVRWLSTGNCLERFLSLYDTILRFAIEYPRSEFTFMNDEESRTLVSYLTDKLNCLNLELQGKNKTHRL